MNMCNKSSLVSGLAILLAVVGTSLPGHSQAKRTASSVHRIDVQNYRIEAILTPDAHELKTLSTITFKPIQATDSVTFELSENLSVQRVLNSDGVELEFGQDEIGPGYLTIRFAKPLAVGSSLTINNIATTITNNKCHFRNTAEAKFNNCFKIAFICTIISISYIFACRINTNYKAGTIK